MYVMGGCIGALLDINFKRAIIEYKVTVELHFVICAGTREGESERELNL